MNGQLIKNISSAKYYIEGKQGLYLIHEQRA